MRSHEGVCAEKTLFLKENQLEIIKAVPKMDSCGRNCSDAVRVRYTLKRCCQEEAAQEERVKEEEGRGGKREREKNNKGRKKT